MDLGKGLITGSIIISVASIICVNILKDHLGRMPIPQTQSIPYINADLSKLENVLTNRDKNALTINEAAVYLGIKEEDFRSMVYGGKLKDIPYVDIAERIVFSKKALDEWLYDSAKLHFVISP